MDEDTEILDDDFMFYSLLYSSITVAFAMAVLSKFLTNEFRFGIRSMISLFIVFIGEPLCHFLLKGSSGVLIFSGVCILVYSILPASHLPAKNKAVLVTGCDSGFGQALVEKLDSIGMKVFAGCLNKDGPGAIHLQNVCSDRMKLVKLDVSDGTQIDDAFEYVQIEVGEEGLWGIVNNAGIGCFGSIEMTSEKLLRRVLEVNLFGTIRTTTKFLPLVRKAKGRVVNVSSIAGKVMLENLSAYSISKAGVEAFSDVLRGEMRPWGVKVSIVQPTGFKTGASSLYNIKKNREEVWNQMSDEAKKLYGRPYLDSLYNNFESSSAKFPSDLTPVVRALRSGLLSMRPMERYAVGMGSSTLLNIYPILPVWIADKLSNLINIPVLEKPLGLQ